MPENVNTNTPFLSEKSSLPDRIQRFHKRARATLSVRTASVAVDEAPRESNYREAQNTSKPYRPPDAPFARVSQQRTAQRCTVVRTGIRPSSLLASVVVAATLTISSVCSAVTWSGSWLPVPDTGTQYNSLSGPFLTDAGCSAAAYNSYPLFIVAKKAGDQTIWVNSTSSDPVQQVWDGWRQVPGGAHTAYAPSVSYYNGSGITHLDVVAVGIYGGSDHHVYLNSYNFTTKTWSGWTLVPGLETNAGVSIVDRHLYAKALGSSSGTSVYQNDFYASSGWKVVPGGLKTKVQICAYKDTWDVPALWASRDVDGQLYNNRTLIFGNEWDGWKTLGYQAVTDAKAAGPLPVGWDQPDYAAFLKGIGDHQVHGLKSSGSDLIPGNKLTDAGLESCTVLFYHHVNSQGDWFGLYRNLLFAKGMGDQKLYFTYYNTSLTVKNIVIQ